MLRVFANAAAGSEDIGDVLAGAFFGLRLRAGGIGFAARFGLTFEDRFHRLTLQIEGLRSRTEKKVFNPPGLPPRAVAREIAERRNHTYGLTNWSAETFNSIRHLFPTLAQMEGIVVSGEEKLLKPDPRIFHLLETRYGLDFSESLFIDDNPDNVRGSEAAGLPAVRFESADQIRALLLG